MKKMILLILLLLIAGCAQPKDFSYGLKQIELISSKYKITPDSYPGDAGVMSSAVAEYKNLKNIKLDKDQEAFDDFLDYRVLSLESDIQFVNSLKYGDFGTTKKGFGCKMRPLIIETAKFKNDSAAKGIEAAGRLKKFMDRYPEKLKLVNISQKNIIFMNATFYELSKDSAIDSSAIESFCPKNTTLGIYRQQFRKETNLSDEYINNLDYENAVNLWKKMMEIE